MFIPDPDLDIRWCRNKFTRETAGKKTTGFTFFFLGPQKNWLIHKYPENHRIDTLTKNDIWKRAAGIAKITYFI
jgi:hypothetical protein